MLKFVIWKCVGAVVASTVTGVSAFAADSPRFTVADREVVATKEQREALGLKWFVDGNLGMEKTGQQLRLYGANGGSSVRVTGTPERPFQKVDPVAISAAKKDFQYLAGGPLFLDPESNRTFLFYHAERHRNTAKNFYSVLGLSVQTDAQGLEFSDLGPFFPANIPSEQAGGSIEVCGSPYVIKDGYFYVFARDVSSNGKPRENNLAVVRASVSEVVRAGCQGKSAAWLKYYNGAFSEPAIGGKSSPLENGNPNTRWMDVSFNTALNKFVLVIAANNALLNTDLFITWSEDGIHWAERRRLTDDHGESFYPSILGFQEVSRQTGKEFYVYYTFSKKGGWGRWDDALIVRRKVTFADEIHTRTHAGDGR